MTLPRSETPLRRSAVGSYRESMARDTTVINDDEAERREARRRTLLVQQDTRKSSGLESIEENEAIRSCVDLYNCNKLSKDNAWHMSLIDSLANLMDRHHKKLSNFKMAGTSLEASSKVYGLRVDSIYIDAMRISAGLSARTLTDKQINDADADDGGGAHDGAPADGEGDDAAAGSSGQQQAAAPKPKRQKKNVSTLTKNKETLNARLDMMPMQDAVFGKLNSTVGSINASNRLMHNILPSVDSELRLRTTHKVWDATEETNELVDSETLSARGQEWPDTALCSAEWLHKLANHVDNLILRPLHTGYVITSAPNPKPQADKPETSMSDPAAPENDDDDEGLEAADDYCVNAGEISVAFDMNAECEPMPDMETGQHIVLEIPSNDLEELTVEEQAVVQNCRRLRKTAEFIDDLRPVDGVSRLDYSYRPMEQISQFWAGPAHWKFKRTRPRSTLAQTNGQTDAVPTAKPRKTAAVAKRRCKEVTYGKFKEEHFQPIDAKLKQRKVNYQKKWDARKLMLPTKFNFEDDYFFKYDSAPSIKVSQRFGVADVDEGLGNDMDTDGGSHHGDADIELFDNEHFTSDDPAAINRMSGAGIEDPMDMMNMDACEGMPNPSQSMHMGHDTIVEIATEYEGAPKQVTKVIVPFAKRAKVIDMKNLKKSCNSLIQKQLLNPVVEAAIPTHPQVKDERYAKGVASFQEVYCTLPDLLTPKMADSLSTSVALYAVLHLANDMKLRLIPQENLEDFKIRQVLD
ncbi:condensin complex subunit 2 [Drosophila guanche]|uniref:Condensin complex subunit 2 n=2 Tax=Drosophila guanche TaxID=7266 RepID=A0A3B0JY24_DROGU|nr:condensin complex subunit 2 [Drosophila guanche]SPP85963.1 blast:Condensin complex subunit 2 [Drosophila guanche]